MHRCTCSFSWIFARSAHHDLSSRCSWSRLLVVLSFKRDATGPLGEYHMAALARTPAYFPLASGLQLLRACVRPLIIKIYSVQRMHCLIQARNRIYDVSQMCPKNVHSFLKMPSTGNPALRISAGSCNLLNIGQLRFGYLRIRSQLLFPVTPDSHRG